MPEPHADDDRTAPDGPAAQAAASAPGDVSPAAASDAVTPAEPRPASVAEPVSGPASATEPVSVADPSPAAVPSEDELARIATPATVRRAPRYRAFVVTGALVGALVGLVLALALASGSGAASTSVGMLPLLDGQNGVRALCALGGAVVGVFAGGALALLADRRSRR